jgi:hypothetical protein
MDLGRFELGQKSSFRPFMGGRRMKVTDIPNRTVKL